jgi:hypothetical protein
MRVKAPAGPLPGRFSSARLLGWAPPFPLVGKGMGMGGERLGTRLLVEADRPNYQRTRPDFPPPTPAPPHKGEGFTRLFRVGRS